MAGDRRFVVQVYVGSLSPQYEALSVEASKCTTAEEMVLCVTEMLQLPSTQLYQLAEVVGDEFGRECKERRLSPHEHPVAVQLLWPKPASPADLHCPDVSAATQQYYRLYLRERLMSDALWTENLSMEPQLLRDYFSRFLQQPSDREYPDLCQLPELTEATLLDNLLQRFNSGHIYTYVNSILLAINPFKFYPIYNPKYVKLYQHRRLDELPPHIFAIADAAYQRTLRLGDNQCIVISGESGSGKTESTNFLLHHLTALSQKGALASGVEQTILAAGPVLEAFGNAKTAHNNNSSRFGKFIQVNYKENGQVHGAVVQKYLLEKSRIVCQARNERNYHVFYYLLLGASEEERAKLHLLPPDHYHYLSQSDCASLEGLDERYEFARLRQSMEMVGFSLEKQSKVYALLSAVLLIGNVTFQNKKNTYHHDESVSVRNPELVEQIAGLMKVQLTRLMAALTHKRARASGELVVINYRMQEAVAARDTIAKCVYGALFDWIVLQLNSSLLARNERSRDHHGPSIGVLDIFGFEDFGNINSFEQLCINYANEHLQYYFNLHVFKYEQEEYCREGIHWQNIEFADNTGCLQLFENKLHGLLAVMDDQCSFPGATNETLLEKFHKDNRGNTFYEVPQTFEPAFLINHYAGKVKYQVAEFREKNLDLMRPDIVSVLKSSSQQLVRELVGTDPVTMFRWAILRAFFRALAAFRQAGQRGGSAAASAAAAAGGGRHQKLRKQASVDPLLSQHTSSTVSERRWSCASSIRVGSVRQRSGSNPSLPSDDLMEQAHSILQKNRSFRPRSQTELSGSGAAGGGWRGLEWMRSSAAVVKSHGSRKPAGTVAAQFQLSLQSLLVTLNQANPFFIRCIKSNVQKLPGRFDDATVGRQLRYTGMLETVRIRQCGYNIRFTYDEFIQMYGILLARGVDSDQREIQCFLCDAGFPSDSYQLGRSKLFLRESGKLQLDYRLHQAILARIVLIQRWFRCVVERRNFLRVRAAAVKIQAQVRCFLAQRGYQNMRVRHMAATLIQKVWRGYAVRMWYSNLRRSLVQFQARVRGNSVRRKFQQMREEYVNTKQASGEEAQSSLYIIGMDKCTPDEAFLSKESSQEELDPLSTATAVGTSSQRRVRRDSDESSGVHEDSDPDSHHRSAENSNNQHTNSASQVDGEVPSRHAVRRRVVRRLRSRPSDDSAPPAALPPRRSSQQLQLSSSASYEPPPQQLPPEPPRRCRLHSGTTDHVLSAAGVPPTPQLQLFSEVPAAAPRRQRAAGSVATPPTPSTPESMVDDGQSTVATPGSEDGRSTVATPGLEDGQRRRSSSCYSHLPPSPQQQHVWPHRFQRTSKMPRAELCLYCQKPITSLFVQGFKCSFCRRYFHPKCVLLAGDQPCHRTPLTLSYKKKAGGIWNLQGTSEFTDREDKVITDIVELKRLEDFIAVKIYEQEHGGKPRDRRKEASSVDRVFTESLKQFRVSLISAYSQARVENTDALNVRYRDLIDNFASMMSSVVGDQGSDFAITMGVNAFRGYLNHFLQGLDESPTTKKHKRRRQKKKKDKKEDETVKMLGHNFQSILINIPTACEICSSFLWLMEKGYVCQNCKLTCHRKCQLKVVVACSKDPAASVASTCGRRLFGVPLQLLMPDEQRVPAAVDKLLINVELRGLYTEGLYRKSGVTRRVNQLKDELELHLDEVELEEVPVHVVAAVVKAFLRELPEPLLTFALYSDLLRAASLPDPGDQVHTVFDLLQQLPAASYRLLERLLFHLARVAIHECDNRMSCNALAVVFAPCILRTNRAQPAQDTLRDVAAQSRCVELMLTERLRRLRSTLRDIDTLDEACQRARHQLSQPQLSSYLQQLVHEKRRLTSSLPRLSAAAGGLVSASDDELLGPEESLAGSNEDLAALSAGGSTVDGSR